MLDEINASRWRGLVHEAEQAPDGGHLFALPEMVLAVQADNLAWQDKAVERWGKHFVCMTLPFFAAGMILGWLVASGQRETATHLHEDVAPVHRPIGDPVHVLTPDPVTIEVDVPKG